MTAMPPLRDILNNTPANAVDVDFNFNTLESHIGSELINRDGSVAMTGPLTLPSAPTAPAHAATKAYVDGNVVPIGVIWEYAGNIAPAGWAFCDGSSKSTTDPAYAALFAVIGYRHGGAGANFNLPDRRARVPLGYSAGDAVAGTLGAKGGNRDAVLPIHQHDIAHGHADTINFTTTGVDINHQHDIAHVHGQGTTDAQGNHQHTFPLRQTSNVGADVGQQAAATGTVGAQATDFAGNHAHNVNIPALGATNSGWMSGNNPHSHPTNKSGGVTAAPGGTLSNQQGVAPTNANFQPYEVVNFIIRIG